MPETKYIQQYPDLESLQIQVNLGEHDTVRIYGVAVDKQYRVVLRTLGRDSYDYVISFSQVNNLKAATLAQDVYNIFYQHLGAIKDCDFMHILNVKGISNYVKINKVTKG